ncbi:transposase [Candidatus Nitrotoga sp. HW29]|uniref:transposase n=1 Tax=Candidatus Nitrotoga sp. HW29 TaxID=2886963 RepID=UPI00403D66A6
MDKVVRIIYLPKYCITHHTASTLASASDTTAILSVMYSYDFGTALEQLAAYLGLFRWNDSRVVRCGDARMSKAGPARIRAVSYMAAVVSKRHNSHTSKLFMNACLLEVSPRYPPRCRNAQADAFVLLCTHNSTAVLARVPKKRLTLKTVSTELR